MNFKKYLKIIGALLLLFLLLMASFFNLRRDLPSYEYGNLLVHENRIKLENHDAILSNLNDVSFSPVDLSPSVIIISTSSVLVFLYLIYMVSNQKKKEDEYFNPAELIRSSKIIYLGESINYLLHQWKQPINNLGLIIANLENIEKRYPDEDLKFLTESGKASILELKNIMETMNQFVSTVEEKNLFEISVIFEKVAKFLEYKISKKEINLKLDLKSDYSVYGYQELFFQMILNITDNALDSIDKKNSNGKVSMKLNRRGNYQVIEISDNGVGISKDKLPLIFLPNYSTKTKKGGSGMGLYITKQIIEHNFRGSINVKSNKEGSTFTIMVPSIKEEYNVNIREH